MCQTARESCLCCKSTLSDSQAGKTRHKYVAVIVVIQPVLYLINSACAEAEEILIPASDHLVKVKSEKQGVEICELK